MNNKLFPNKVHHYTDKVRTSIMEEQSVTMDEKSILTITHKTFTAMTNMHKTFIP